ncbi:VRR-NUC domain-containing protein [Leptolyngbya sp. PCC 7375]|nr:VRR-NUC domain-containing protein [Leptolyngbya sp. PCC 7375]
MPTLESEIERKIGQYVKATGGLYLKQDSRFNPGIPDRLVMYPSALPILFELKQANGRFQKTQEFKLPKLKAQGYRVHIVRSLESFKEILLGYKDIQQSIQNAKRKKSKKSSKTGYQIFT